MKKIVRERGQDQVYGCVCLCVFGSAVVWANVFKFDTKTLKAVPTYTRIHRYTWRARVCVEDAKTQTVYNTAICTYCVAYACNEANEYKGAHTHIQWIQT